MGEHGLVSTVVRKGEDNSSCQQGNVSIRVEEEKGVCQLLGAELAYQLFKNW